MARPASELSDMFVCHLNRFVSKKRVPISTPQRPSEGERNKYDMLVTRTIWKHMNHFFHEQCGWDLAISKEPIILTTSTFSHSCYNMLNTHTTTLILNIGNSKENQCVQHGTICVFGALNHCSWSCFSIHPVLQSKASLQ